MTLPRLAADLNRPLDELIQERPHERPQHYQKRAPPRTRRSPRRDDYRRGPREEERGGGHRGVSKPDARRQPRRYSPRRQPGRREGEPRNHQQQQHHRQPQSAIRVTNLHYEVSEKDIKELFESIGPVQRAVIDFDRAGRSNGSAAVHFFDRDDAYRARERFQNVPLDGKAMQIEVMRSQPLSHTRDMSMELDADMDRYMMSHSRTGSNNTNQRYYQSNSSSNRMQID